MTSIAVPCVRRCPQLTCVHMCTNAIRATNYLNALLHYQLQVCQLRELTTPLRVLGLERSNFIAMCLVGLDEGSSKKLDGVLVVALVALLT